MKNFRTYDLALDFYQKCQKIKIKNSIVKNQFERASLSVVLNIAEGSGKLTTKDRRKFYSIAMGSLRETQCLLKILKEEFLLKNSDKLGGYLYKLIQNLVRASDTHRCLLPRCLLCQLPEHFHIRFRLASPSLNQEKR